MSCTCTWDAKSEDEGGESELGNSLRDYAARMLRSRVWGWLVTGMILANTAFMVVEAQWHTMEQFLLDHWIFEEKVFLFFFTFEVAMRVYVRGCSEYFNPAGGYAGAETARWQGHWNRFDFTVVVLGLLAFLVQPLGFMDPEDQDEAPSLMILRGMRVLRIVRIFSHSRMLRLMLKGVIKSFEPTFWIMTFQLLVSATFATFFTLSVGLDHELWNPTACRNCDDRHDELLIQSHFGSLGKSMWVMTRFIVLDSWSSIQNLVCKRLWWMKFIFAAYLLIASFALVSLLTGVVAQHMTSETQLAVKEERRQKVEKYTRKLHEIFREREGGTSDGLSQDKLDGLLNDPHVKDSLAKIRVLGEFSHQDIKDIFYEMDSDGSNIISWEEFRYGLQNLGDTSDKKLALVRADLERVERVFRSHGADVLRAERDARLTSLEKHMDHLETMVLKLVEIRSQRQQHCTT